MQPDLPRLDMLTLRDNERAYRDYVQALARQEGMSSGRGGTSLNQPCAADLPALDMLILRGNEWAYAHYVQALTRQEGMSSGRGAPGAAATRPAPRPRPNHTPLTHSSLPRHTPTPAPKACPRSVEG
mgnify:CR=1 FL=1